MAAKGIKRQNGRHKLPDGITRMKTKKRETLLAQVTINIPPKTERLETMEDTTKTKTKAGIIYYERVPNEEQFPAVLEKVMAAYDIGSKMLERDKNISIAKLRADVKREMGDWKKGSEAS
jgi:hypothetical protein